VPDEQPAVEGGAAVDRLESQLGVQRGAAVSSHGWLPGSVAPVDAARLTAQGWPMG